VRYRLARAEGVPAFIIFSNATLVDMADRRPRTTAEFLTVSGVGQTKAQRYAEPFLAAIRAFQDE
jgi:ATP-dependent DNA helicase RecQ